MIMMMECTPLDSTRVKINKKLPYYMKIDFKEYCPNPESGPPIIDPIFAKVSKHLTFSVSLMIIIIIIMIITCITMIINYNRDNDYEQKSKDST